MVTVSLETESSLPRLLERVAAGESILITRQGREVARLLPPASSTPEVDAASAVAHWKKSRKGVTLGGISLRELIDHGRA